MAGFFDKDGVLHAEGVSLTEIAARFGTPAYVYSANGIRESVGALRAALAEALPPQCQPLIAFACKANGNLAILRLMAGMGLGADVVSGGEMKRALAAGISPGTIVFSGVGKSADEIRAAIETGILQINVESGPELERIARIAETLKKKIDVALRFNPDVEAGTHAKITTGKEENKFGMPRETVARLYRRFANHGWVRPAGLSLHIGSQLTDLSPFRQAFERMAALARDLKAEGLAVDSLDAGGGLGIVYRNEAAADLRGYAALLRDILHPLGTRIVLEPGRLLTGASGLLLTKVEYVKETAARRYVILDAGMNDLIRPTLYEAFHPIRAVRHAPAEEIYPCDIVGPVCETGDTFAVNRPLAKVAEGDLVAIMASGAYGFSMASTYNTRPLPPEILVDGDRAAIIRRRQSVKDILEMESIPEWIKSVD